MEEPTKPKRGRKPIDEPVHNLAIRIRESEFTTLSNTANQSGKTISAYIRDLIAQDQAVQYTNIERSTFKVKTTTYSVFTQDIPELINKLSKILIK